MQASTSLLDEALEAWAYARSGVAAEVENMPADSLDFRPTEHSRSTRELVVHIVEAGLMMSGELPRPDGDFQRQSYPELLEEHAGDIEVGESRQDLLELLRRTHEDGAERIRQAGEVAMLQVIRQFNGEPATRLAWMGHGIAHEEYHRGQLALYARLQGTVPALTKLIQGG